MAVFTPRALAIPSLTTNYSAENSAFSNLGQTLGNLPGDIRKEQLQQQKQQLLGQLANGKADYNKVGLGLVALGDTQAGASLLALGQKQQERDLEKSWMSGGAAPPPVASSAPVAGPASLIQNESGGNWQAQNNAVGSGGAVGHFGRLQFGQARIQDAVNAGALPPGTTPQTFMASPELQKRAEAWHFNDIDEKIRQNGFDKLIGQPINGVPVTIDGLRAVAHLGGTEGMRKFVESGGRYNPADENGTRLSDYFARHGGAGGQPQTRVAQAPQPAPVQVAENESDVARLEAQMPGYGGARPAQVAQASGAGDNVAKLRADAQYYAQSNPEAARQFNARADALERGNGGQVAQAPGAADLPPQGANATPTQGFAIPGEPAQQSILNDKNVQLWTQRHASAPTERTRAIAKQQLDLAVKDAEQRYAEGKTPEAVREFVWAKRNGMTEAKSPAEYAREKEKPKGPVTVGEGQRLVDPETGRVIVEAQSGAKTSREIDERTAIADRQGLQGDAREAYILNGRVPVGAEKTTEGQANAALYADRMKEAETIFARPGMTEAGMSRFERGKSALPGGNSLVSSEFQQVDQAQRNFINAALRRESGAVISEQEFENARQQYFPQPGDGKEVLAQKARNRQTAIQGISNAAGPAYAKRQKEAPQQQFREGQRASNGQQTIIFRNGQWVPE